MTSQKSRKSHTPKLDVPVAVEGEYVVITVIPEIVNAFAHHQLCYINTLNPSLYCAQSNTIRNDKAFVHNKRGPALRNHFVSELM